MVVQIARRIPGEGISGVATMERWSGREARLLRQALRLSVRNFAEDLGINPRTISKWEAAGEERCPRPEYQAILDTALARATEEQQERLEQALQGGEPSPEAATDLPVISAGSGALGGNPGRPLSASRSW
jgi:hypothetical protein